MKPITITEELLAGACEEGLDFAKNYKMMGRTIINRSGDYEDYLGWLEARSKYTHDYDDRGNVIIKRGFYGDTILKYDDNDNCIETKYSNGTVVYCEYDEHNNLIAEIVPKEKGQSSNFEYDDRGNRTKTIWMNGDEWIWEYDENNNQVKYTDRVGDFQTWEYDSNSKLIKTTMMNGKSHTWEYNDQGKEIKHTNPRGQVGTKEYENGNLVKVEQSHRTTLYEYDDFGRNTKESTIVDGKTRVHEWQYNEFGMVSREIDIDGDETRWSFGWLNEDNFVVNKNGDVICRIQFKPVDQT